MLALWHTKVICPDYCNHCLSAFVKTMKYKQYSSKNNSNSIIQSHAKYRIIVFIEFLSSTLDSETMSKLSTVDMTSGIERILKIFSSSLFSDRTITIHSSRRRKKCWTNCPYKDEECSTVFESNDFVWSGSCSCISGKLQTFQKQCSFITYCC